MVAGNCCSANEVHSCEPKPIGGLPIRADAPPRTVNPVFFLLMVAFGC